MWALRVDLRAVVCTARDSSLRVMISHIADMFANHEVGPRGRNQPWYLVRQGHAFVKVRTNFEGMSSRRCWCETPRSACTRAAAMSGRRLARERERERESRRVSQTRGRSGCRLNPKCDSTVDQYARDTMGEFRMAPGQRVGGTCLFRGLLGLHM